MPSYNTLFDGIHPSFEPLRVICKDLPSIPGCFEHIKTPGWVSNSQNRNIIVPDDVLQRKHIAMAQYAHKLESKYFSEIYDAII